MKRHVFVLAVLVALVFLTSTGCLAIFPKPDFPPIGFGYLGYDLQLGWFDNAQAWYLHEDGSTNDIGTAKTLAPFYWLAPELSSALTPKAPGGDIAARPIYIVLNPEATQGPVFSTVPGEPLYSGLWQIFYILWKDGAVKRPIINSNASPDPQGLPPASDADITATGIVAQFPIVATGPLGGPWIPEPPGTYRMKQIVVESDYAASKEVFLPTFSVFCSELVSKRVTKEVITIPDVGDSTLADLLGANLAPGLLNVPDSDTQAFWSIISSPYLCQLPMLEQCPQGAGGERQTNKDFTPIVRLTYLNRVGLPPYAVINNKFFVSFLIGSGFLTVASDTQRMGILFLNEDALPW